MIITRAVQQLRTNVLRRNMGGGYEVYPGSNIPFFPKSFKSPGPYFLTLAGMGASIPWSIYFFYQWKQRNDIGW
ncbi:hypothetical protein ACHWQZ_G011218 [Mnemiopsis leidyi]